MWNAKLTLDDMSKNYHTLEKSQPSSASTAVVPHVRI